MYSTFSFATPHDATVVTRRVRGTLLATNAATNEELQPGDSRCTRVSTVPGGAIPVGVGVPVLLGVLEGEMGDVVGEGDVVAAEDAVLVHDGEVDEELEPLGVFVGAGVLDTVPVTEAVVLAEADAVALPLGDRETEGVVLPVLEEEGELVPEVLPVADCEGVLDGVTVTLGVVEGVEDAVAVWDGVVVLDPV